MRVLFSLREDYLANLEAYSKLIPSIASNRMLLKRILYWVPETTGVLRGL